MKLYWSLRMKRLPSPSNHSTSASALLGGGSTVYPGEISLAHRGVLFMDEFAQWPGEVLDQLRQPLQDGHITLKRGKRSVTVSPPGNETSCVSKSSNANPRGA